MQTFGVKFAGWVTCRIETREFYFLLYRTDYFFFLCECNEWYICSINTVVLAVFYYFRPKYALGYGVCNGSDNRWFRHQPLLLPNGCQNNLGNETYICTIKILNILIVNNVGHFDFQYLNFSPC